jgi:hypothetical protein
MEQHMVRIDRTYNTRLYAGLPWGAMLAAQAWLIAVHLSFGHRSQSYQGTINLLRVLGYRVDTQGDLIHRITPTEYSVLPVRGLEPPVLGPLIDQAVKACLSEDLTIAKHLLDFAKLLERKGQSTFADSVQMFKKRMIGMGGKSLSDTAMEQKMAKLGL